jgi:arylsulfatase A-like enzyme
VRWLVVTVPALLLALGLTDAAAAQTRPPRVTVPEGAKRPNIVLILADDVGREAFGSYGGTSFQTPNLDRLAAEGMRFTRVYATAVCAPTRSQLMTGMYTFRNYDVFGKMDPANYTFANYLHSAGYATAISGKWQLGGSFQTPHHFGFDEYLVWQLEGPDNKTRYKNPVLTRNGEQTLRHEGGYGPDLFQDFALDFIERHRDGPFFLYYTTPLVHDPFQPPSSHPDFAASDPNTWDDPKYFGPMLTYLDTQVGELMAKLDQLGIRENTLVIFAADNGDIETITSRLADGREIVGDKGNPRDAGFHEPLIFNWKGTIGPRQVRDDLVDLADVFPTLMELGGVTVAGLPTDYISLLPTLLEGKPHPRQWMFLDFYRNRTAGPHPERKGGGRVIVARLVHDGHYKLYSDGRFFDFLKDPLEQHPLSDAELTPEARAARAALRRVMTEKEAEIREVESRRPPELPVESNRPQPPRGGRPGSRTG